MTWRKQTGSQERMSMQDSKCWKAGASHTTYYSGTRNRGKKTHWSSKILCYILCLFTTLIGMSFQHPDNTKTVFIVVFKWNCTAHLAKDVSFIYLQYFWRIFSSGFRDFLKGGGISQYFVHTIDNDDNIVTIYSLVKICLNWSIIHLGLMLFIMHHCRPPLLKYIPGVVSKFPKWDVVFWIFLNILNFEFLHYSHWKLDGVLGDFLD